MMRSQRGMTLIEVLVALAIFATASLSIIRAVTQHTNTLGYIEEKTFASIVADNQIALVTLEGAPSSKKTGKADMVGRTWYWQVTPVKNSVDFLGAFDVSVFTDKTMKDPLVTVRSYAEK